MYNTVVRLCQINNLLLYPSLSPYRQTDRQTDGDTCFAWAGGTCPRFTWAGGTFFPVVLLCQFLVLAGNRQFFCCGEKVLLQPEKIKVLVVCLVGCAVVSVFGSGGK